MPSYTDYLKLTEPRTVGSNRIYLFSFTMFSILILYVEVVALFESILTTSFFVFMVNIAYGFGFLYYFIIVGIIKYDVLSIFNPK
jgi:hypothetical protein